MSTEVREEIAAAGASGGDDGLDPTLGPPPPDPDAPGKDEPTAPEWLASADEDLRTYASNKGWDKDPTAAFKSYQEMERTLHEGRQREARMESELASFRAQAQQMAGGGQQQQQDPVRAQVDDFIARVDAAYEAGEMSTAEHTRHILDAAQFLGRHEAQQASQQAIGPVAQKQMNDTMAQTAQQIAETYDDFGELSDEVLDLINKQPQLYGSPEGMWAAYGLVKSQHQVKQQAEQRSANRMETLDTSSRSDGAQEASAAIRKQLREVRQTPRDGL